MIMQSRSALPSRVSQQTAVLNNAPWRQTLARLHVRSAVISSNDIKNGVTLEINQQPFKVIEFLHVKPGKGAAFVRSKLKNCISGSIIDKTFRAGESLTTADYVFMDMTSYEETRVEKDASWAKYLKEGSDVVLVSYKDKVISVEPPQTVEMKVVSVESIPAGGGSGGTRPVVVESGAVIQVPQFVKEGDVIKIDTKRDVYISRV